MSNLTALLATSVSTEGTPVVVSKGLTAGGVITNPYDAIDQGLLIAEPLYVSFVYPATTAENNTTFVVYPGYSIGIPGNASEIVTVNANTSGHLFSGFIIVASSHYTPPIVTLPTGPTTVTKIIPSYLYQEYQDDDDLQTFVNVYNQMAQEYVDWLNTINLPVYTGTPVSGNILDWVATGLYGYPRPVLPAGAEIVLGPLNTWTCNQLPLNSRKLNDPTSYYVTTDDIYKRCLTWHFYKGDGKYFSIRWLKRRVMRFLEGINGDGAGIAETYQVSVTFSGTSIGIPGKNIRTVIGGAICNAFSLNTVRPNELKTVLEIQPPIFAKPVVTIRLISHIRTIMSAAICNRFGLNTTRPNQFITKDQPLPPFSIAKIFKAAVDSGALELPFQYQFVVVIA